ncbi:DUF4238 domain-containing protein [Devosia sp. MC532]|uniref:DUF4238 domain-containing protein n=1 Tax=Devosia sp. MC532 TaxID=2799788 RepID=UPI0018F44807|nr:DUF4238 domain-containing protein [Devosia sp. MC532]
MGHHYVPRFLLREWLIDHSKQRVLRGNYYDPYSRRLRERLRGENFFCNVPDLFTVRGLPSGDDAIERIFFKSLDDDAAIAHQLILQGADLTSEQRVHFVRLVLSIVARSPALVSYVKQRRVASDLAMNDDPEIRKFLDEQGEYRPAKEVWEDWIGFSSEDQAMETVQSLTTNARVGTALLNAPWGVVRLPNDAERFVLGDRPLTIAKDYSPKNNLWVLPLSPHVAWYCAMSNGAFRQATSISPSRFVKLVNGWSASLSDKYVFSLQATKKDWLLRRLRQKHEPAVLKLEDGTGQENSRTLTSSLSGT